MNEFEQHLLRVTEPLARLGRKPTTRASEPRMLLVSGADQERPRPTNDGRNQSSVIIHHDLQYLVRCRIMNWSCTCTLVHTYDIRRSRVSFV